MRGKNKKSPEELEAERSARLSGTLDKMNTNLMKLDKVKKTYVDKIVEAEKKGLSSQASQARAMLKKCMAQEKQINGMVMSIEIAIQSKELSSITESFLTCMNDISADLASSSEKINLKKTQKQYMHAMYAQKQQEDDLNRMLDTGNITLFGTEADDEISEFDDEIDAMIKAASGGTISGITGTNKNIF